MDADSLATEARLVRHCLEDGAAFSERPRHSVVERKQPSSVADLLDEL